MFSCQDIMDLLDNKTLSSEGAKAGLIFGTVSGAYIFLAQMLQNLGQTGAIITYILSIAKLVGLIWLMRFYMTRLNEVYDEVDWKQTFCFGLYTAFFSALITAACAYMAYAYVYPTLAQQSLEAVIQAYGNNIDSNTQNEMMKMIEHFPLISFFTYFIWCYIYGTMLSLFLAKRVSNNNTTEIEEDENE